MTSQDEHTRFTFIATLPGAPTAGRAECECGRTASIGDDAHLMTWWRAHQADPAAHAAEIATRLGIR